MHQKAAEQGLAGILPSPAAAWKFDRKNGCDGAKPVMVCSRARSSWIPSCHMDMCCTWAAMSSMLLRHASLMRLHALVVYLHGA